MRLLHVVPSYYLATRYGGPIRSVYGLCTALVKQGHEVHVFTTNVDGDGDSDVPMECPVDLDGVKVSNRNSLRINIQSIRSLLLYCSVKRERSRSKWKPNAKN